MFRSKSILVLILLVLLVSPMALAGGGMRPEHAPHAMVVSVHELASQAGVEVMKQGGNAVDAAVATGFALAVVWPTAGNIGGGGFMLVRMADGQTHFLDYREKAPGKATEDMYWDKQGNVVPGMSTLGYKAVGVPGSVKGLAYAEQHWGKLGLKRVMSPAIRMAREGFPLSYGMAQSMTRDKGLAQFAESKRIFQNGGKGWKQGDVLRQPELASTLERIADNPDDFYKGEIAKQFAAFMQKNGGLITTDDLANYEAKERAPVRGTYRGYEIISAPPPSSGGAALVEALNILEGYDLASTGDHSAEMIHLVTEAYRRAFFDRATFMGDPDFSKVPVAQLIDKKYAAAWRASIEPQHATLSQTLRRPAEFADLDRYAQGRKPATGAESHQTTHYSVVDADGNAVSVTTTLNGGYGSKVTAEGLGFLLNNEMDDFAAKVGVPNMYGLIQGPANAVGANKRPLSAMTPTIVLKDGKLWLVVGSPGGPTIITTVANIIIGMIDFGDDIQQAVDSPRFHHQWLPDRLSLESGISPDTVRLLQSRGHKIQQGRTDSETRSSEVLWGDGECIAIDLKTGERLGASDARNETGKAVGY